MRTTKSHLGRLCSWSAGILGFAIAASLLRTVVPAPLLDLADVKRRHFEAAPNPIDTVFVGTSHFYRSVDPARFDATMRGAGHPTQSFNLAVQGLRAPELLQRWGRLLATEESAHLRRVILDVAPLGWEVETRNLTRDRVVRWHTLGALAQLLPWHAIEPDRSLGERIAAGARHLLPGLLHQANWGRGSIAFRQQMGMRRDEVARFESRLGLHRDGFFSLDADLAQRSGDKRAVLEERQADLVEAAATWPARKAEQQRALQAEPGDLDRLAEPIHREIARRAHERGIKAYFVAVPHFLPRLDLRASRAAGAIDDLWLFDDPAAHPQLFDPELRFDIGHLNRAGAEVFTDLLAQRLSEDLDAPGREANERSRP